MLFPQKTELLEKIKKLPNSTGIYFYKNKNQKILYIGKAINIKKRVQSYFYNRNDNTLKTTELLKNSWDLDWIVTLSESDALVLEDQMIKQHKPKYNIMLKDDKSYPYIKITTMELYPRVMLTRELQEKNAHYFGPYTSVKEARLTIETIRKHFPLRTSKMDLDGTKTYKPCLNFQMKKCLAPCRGNIDVAVYQKMVLGVLKILRGASEGLIKELQKEMEQKSREQEFEEAALLRNKIFAVQRTIKKQTIITKEKNHKDIIAIFRKQETAGIQILFVRSGILFASDFFFITEAQSYSDEELLRTSFSKLYLGKNKIFPNEIILSTDCEKQGLEEYFEKRNQKITILIPQKGEKKRLVKMALENAEKNLSQHLDKNIYNQKILAGLQEKLRLKSFPKRIECFDISNLQGKNVVASMVVMENNQFIKKDYRKFKIRTATNDDVASMREVLFRRWTKAMKNEQPLPDLTLLDGGKGQLNGVLKLAEQMNLPLQNMDILAIAKGRSLKRKTSDKTQLEFDYLIQPNRKNPMAIKSGSQIFRPLQKIRDEAHRFALTFHRKLRDKQTLASPLQAIDGIGEAKKKNLLFHFKNIENIKQASQEKLQSVPLITKKDAESIYQFFQKTISLLWGGVRKRKTNNQKGIYENIIRYQANTFICSIDFTEG